MSLLFRLETPFFQIGLSRLNYNTQEVTLGLGGIRDVWCFSAASVLPYPRLTQRPLRAPCGRTSTRGDRVISFRPTTYTKVFRMGHQGYHFGETALMWMSYFGLTLRSRMTHSLLIYTPVDDYLPTNEREAMTI